MEWISIKDKLPETNTNCLVFLNNKVLKQTWVETSFFTDDFFYFVIGDYKYITHWMPLPNPPKD